MSMTKNKKWSRLLFTLLIVVALGLTMLPTAVFADVGDECRPSGECDLQVNIVKPAPGTEVPVGQCFWVNAAVARPYDSGTIDGVTATLIIDSGDGYIDCSAQQGPVQLNNCNEVVDFWWKICCTGTDDVTFHVEATSTTTSPCQTVYAGVSAPRTVVQIDPVCSPCLVMEIIECGPEDEQGALMPAYPNESVYAVKALIHNVCDVMICGVIANITWEGDAELIDGYPQQLNVGCIFPNRAEEVGWTFMCTGGEDAVFTVDAECTAPSDPIPPDCNPCDEPYIPDPCNGKCVVQTDTCVVDQICPAAIGVTIAPLPEKICTTCDSYFIVTAHVCETCGETDLENVFAELHITGDVVVTEPLLRSVCPSLAAGGCADVSWTIDCTGPAPADLYVTVQGSDAYNNQVRNATSDPYQVEQKDNLSVTITSPADDEIFNVCENYDLTFTVTNCSDADIYDAVVVVTLGDAVNVDYAGTMAHIEPCDEDDDAYDVAMTDLGRLRSMEIVIDCVGSCCCVEVTVPLKCIGSGVENCNINAIAPETIEVMVGPAIDNLVDDDTVVVHQMYKAHLTSQLAVYEGVVTAEADTLEGESKICAVAQGESFTVVGLVANQGEATAQDVMVTLDWDDNPGVALSPDTPATQNIGNIGCHGAAKAIWQFTCIGEGKVNFDISAISGIDANTGVAIHFDNEVKPTCDIDLEQVPFQVTIVQPLTSTDFLEYECFTVKARVTNLSSFYKLDNVMATLRWYTEEEGCSPCGDFTLSTPKTVDVTPGDDMLMPGESSLVTWQVCCCEAGDVSFWIDVDAVTVFDNLYNVKGGCSLDIMSEVNTIHQWEKGGVVCYILSPKLQDYDVCHEYGDPEAYIATGQEFSVTGKLINTGDLPFMIDTIELMADGWGWMGDIEVLGTSFGDLTQSPIVLAPHGQTGDSIVVSFDVICTEAGKTDILMQAGGVSLPPDQTVGVRDTCMSFVCIEQYEAAHLVVNITSSYPDPIDLGSEFEITATVTNTGEADAWEVSAMISVFPSTSAEVSYNDQYGSYTRDLGNLTGHTVNESQEVTWLMRCKDVCDTTITVTAMGYDESGYEVKQICTSEIMYDWQITCCELLLDGTPGAPIQSRFIEPASITVKQQDPDDPDPDPQDPSNNFTMTLYPGWNLVSSPWFLADTDPGVVFASAIPGVQKIYAYDRATTSWQIYNADGGPGDLTEFRDGPGYWILVDDTLTDPLTVSLFNGAAGNPDWTPPTYTVSMTGWSLIGPRIGEPPSSTTATAWLNPLSFALILGFDADAGVYFTVGPNDYVQPGQGYWVAFTTTGDRYR